MGRSYQLPLDSPRRIPDAIQKPIRDRFRTLRSIKNLQCGDFSQMSPGTVTQYELHDISTMQIGVLYRTALDLDMTFNEFMDYLIGNEETDEREGTQAIRRVTTMMRILSEDEQNVILDAIIPLVDFMTSAHLIK